MKSIHAACLLALLPVVAFAQATAPTDAPPKDAPIEPVVASQHDGPGRVGVSLIFDKTTGQPQISALIRGGPAADVGFKVGDVIIKIDRNYTNTLTEDECRMALHGEPGTGVELTVQRGDDPKFIIRAIERRVLSPKSDDMLERIIPPPPAP